MKVQELHGIEDRLLLAVDGTVDAQAKLDGELEPFFQALEQYAGEWMPDVVEGKRRRKYTRAAVLKSLEEQRGEPVVFIGLYRTMPPALDMTLSVLCSARPTELDIFLEVQPLSFFAEAWRCQQLVELVRAWASRYRSSHAWVHGSADNLISGAPDFGRDERVSRRDGFDKIYEVSWLNVFGPKLVETVGRERMLSTPAHRVEELPNGAILLVTWPTVTDFASDEARAAQARAHAHLRPDLELASVRQTLRERSAMLAPVEPRFHPEVAPLHSRVVEHTAIHERSRTITRFNASPPPEPEEWRPLPRHFRRTWKTPSVSSLTTACWPSTSW